MANYEGTARSNYFKVKDADAFKAWCLGCSLEFFESAEHDGLYAIASADPDGGGWPSQRDDSAGNELEEFDLVDELAGHLAGNSVAILMESGHEKLRYVTGIAIAVNAKGKSIQIALEDIYDKGAALGEVLTRCEY